MFDTFNDKAMIVLRADANKNFLTLSLFGGLFTYSEIFIALTPEGLKTSKETPSDEKSEFIQSAFFSSSAETQEILSSPFIEKLNR